jgi:hypothetical protein
METLPNELTLAIAMEMTAVDCVALARSSPKYEWLLNETALWSHFAVRELKLPRDVFERELDSMNPAQFYQQLANCHHQSFIPGTRFLKICANPVFPGTPYCRNHCAEYGLTICLCCDNRIIDRSMDFRFCRTCINTDAWKNECQYINPTQYNQCGRKRQPGKEYCSECLALIAGQTCPHKRDFFYYAWSIAPYYVLRDKFEGIVVRLQPDGTAVAMGRLPKNLYETASTLADLMPLSDDELQVVQQDGLIVSV